MNISSVKTDIMKGEGSRAEGQSAGTLLQTAHGGISEENT